MKIRLRKKDILLISSLACLLVIIIALGWPQRWFVVMAVCSPVLIVAILLEAYRRLGEEHQATRNHVESLLRSMPASPLTHEIVYQRIESLLSIFFTIKPTLPLPNIRGWSASPDLLKKITEVVLWEKPEFVVETGSGVSTLIIAYCLKRLGRGKVVSLEHDTAYAAINRDILTFHGLEGVATIVDAPLNEVNIKGEKWLWYDVHDAHIDGPIDLLFVDGPPGPLQRLSRYPALPLLCDYLSDAATIILDDGNREDEKNIAALWQKEYGSIATEFLDIEKGAFIMKKKRSAESPEGT